MMQHTHEMEHKLWLYKRPDDLHHYPALHITQYYLDLFKICAQIHLTEQGSIRLHIYSAADNSLAFDLTITPERCPAFLQVFLPMHSDCTHSTLPTDPSQYSARVRLSVPSASASLLPACEEPTFEITFKGPPRLTSWGVSEATLPLSMALASWGQWMIFLHMHLRGEPIIKTRHLIPATPSGLQWEVDVFEGNLAPMLTAECEVPSENVSCPQPPSHWDFAVITGMHAYSNSNLTESTSHPPAPARGK